MGVAAKAWGELSAEQQKPYIKMADEDLLLYNKRMDQRAKLGYFKFDDGSKSTDPQNAKLVKKPKSEKKSKRIEKEESEEEEKVETVQPARVKSAYNCFVADYQKQIPESTKNTDRMGMCSAAWKALSDADKKKFDLMHDADQKRHDLQLAELAEKGYFTFDDGSKSTDHAVKKKKTQKVKDEAK